VTLIHIQQEVGYNSSLWIWADSYNGLHQWNMVEVTECDFWGQVIKCIVTSTLRSLVQRKGNHCVTRTHITVPGEAHVDRNQDVQPISSTVLQLCKLIILEVDSPTPGKLSDECSPSDVWLQLHEELHIWTDQLSTSWPTETMNDNIDSGFPD
jgi:hypothetical protein